MKKIIALILVIASTATLFSCALIRKATVETETAESADVAPSGSESYATDFSETTADDTDSTAVKYTKEQALDLLSHSFPDYDMDYVKIEDADAIIAENDGTEYYIFNVSLPVIKETEAPAESDEEESETETEEIEMEPPVPYYVSVNGVVHSKIGDENVDTKTAEGTFFSKYGKEDKDGNPYKLVYSGLIESKGKLCYSFEVYKGAAGDEFEMNYYVTIDGKLSADDKKSN